MIFHGNFLRSHRIYHLAKWSHNKLWLRILNMNFLWISLAFGFKSSEISFILICNKLTIIVWMRKNIVIILKRLVLVWNEKGLWAAHILHYGVGLRHLWHLLHPWHQRHFIHLGLLLCLRDQWQVQWCWLWIFNTEIIVSNDFRKISRIKITSKIVCIFL